MDAGPLDPTQRFSNRVDDYVRYRPFYPKALIDLLRRACGMTAEWIVADVGSGPGNLTRLFLDHGNRVHGIEPNREMREAGERLLGGYPRFTSVIGTAEETTLPDGSVDLVVAGQAFHWFDPARARREFARVLRPPRWVALVWNERRVDATPFLAAYERLMLAHGTDYATVGHSNADPTNTIALDAFFGADGYTRATFENRQLFDFEGLRGRLLSSSYAPAAGQPGHDLLLTGLRAAFDVHQENGAVSFEYNTTVSYGCLR
ncbi:MAG TPA: class I SAM-dependent methyltransferase [Chloroflexota bacterium]|nr:class I SAM-dependent methyltransferase [Chloroflexota bacterium]